MAICLDLPWTSSREAMEVAAGVVPLDLRFCEIAIRDVAKIAAKRQDDPLKNQLNKSGLENCTRPLVFTSGSSVRASENCHLLARQDE